MLLPLIIAKLLYLKSVSSKQNPFLCFKELACSFLKFKNIYYSNKIIHYNIDEQFRKETELKISSIKGWNLTGISSKKNYYKHSKFFLLFIFITNLSENLFFTMTNEYSTRRCNVLFW